MKILLRIAAAFVIALSTLPVSAQDTIPLPTDYQTRMRGFDTRQAIATKSLVANLPFRNIGPTIMSGRVTDLAVNPENPEEFYVAYASGGLWKTMSNATKLTPLFDDQASMTIGDIAVDWKHNELIYVGTGENNSSRSSYAGTGIYKSSDKGKTWKNIGLPESHHIGRIILHPADTNTLWVAVTGHLYSPNTERGIYKTTDGGQTWSQTLFVNENTGAIDLVIDPGNPQVLYASMWERKRRAWNFWEAGEGSGIYKSADGGNTWMLISGENSGFPDTKNTGRIGLAIYPGNTKILYAFLDNQERQEEKDVEQEDGLTRDALLIMERSEFLKLDEKELEGFLRENNFDEEYSASRVNEMMQDGIIEPADLVEYLHDANAMLFDTPVKGAEVYKSTNGGQTWEKTHEGLIEDVVFSYGYYFGEIRVSATDENKIFIMGVPILKSDNGGKSFTSIQGENAHVDHHALWVNPKDDDHLINGNDGGVNISYDGGDTWLKLNPIPLGQFYAVNVDMAEPYNVYGGLQDNGVWYGSSANKPGTGWQMTGNYPFDEILGGDGMQTEIDTRNNNIVFTGFQFGNYYRINKKTNETTPVQPRHKLGEHPLRFNWQTPIHLSRHNQDILYLGSHKFHRSMNQGDDWETLSEDLTKGGKKGDVAYGTLTTIHESPLRFGLIYTGTDDGLVHVSKDGGYTWENISAGLPENMWVSRVWASHHKLERVYMALNGYRWDHFEAYLYMSDDYGQTWQRVGEDLPAEPVNVFKEDPVNENLLYAGTDHALYLSLDGGKTFMAAGKNLPNVAIHDLVVHPREHDLVLGTHGRSIYIASVKELQQLTPEILEKDLHLFAPEDITFSSSWGETWSKWLPALQPEVQLAFYAAEKGEATLKITTEEGLLLAEKTKEIQAGLNYFSSNLTVQKEAKEKYKASLLKEKSEKTELIVKESADGNLYLQPGTYKVELVMSNERGQIVLKINNK